MTSKEQVTEKPDCTCRHYNGQYVYDPNCKAHPDESELAKLKRDNENFKTVMIAAAEEIKAHWQAHCDSEGYGPANLMHRLEKGIPAQYGYTAGAFEKLQSENDKLKEEIEKLKGLTQKVYLEK